MQFGQHEYIDLSDLNAKWDQALPAVAGLGSSNGSLSGNSLGMTGGLGADPTYPWREYSPDTKALQSQINISLAANGYMPITADGKLGPATCGAARTMCSLVNVPGGCTPPTTCQSFTDPTPVRSGGIPGGGPMVRTAGGGTYRASMGGGTNWLLWGGAVAAVAVGGAMIFRASKKR